jgi:PAS domain S-box-containing protein
MLGYEREDIAGASFCDFTHPDDVAEDREFMAAAIAGELDSHEREKRYVCKDRSIVWARVRGELIRDEAGEPLYFVAHLQDISERRTAQEQSRESERTLRSVIDNTPAMISVKGRDYRYRLVNREFERFFGVSSSWIVGRSDENILPASALDAIHAKDRLVLGVGRPSRRSGRACVTVTSGSSWRSASRCWMTAARSTRSASPRRMSPSIARRNVSGASACNARG